VNPLLFKPVNGTAGDEKFGMPAGSRFMLLLGGVSAGSFTISFCIGPLADDLWVAYPGLPWTADGAELFTATNGIRVEWNTSANNGSALEILPVKIK